MTSRKQDLVDLSHEVWERLQAQLGGLSDDEYLWEPVAGCWTLSKRDDGRFQHDVSIPGPDPAPFTTLAWRLWHIIDLYGENRLPNLLGLEHQGDAVGLEDPTDPTPPATAEAALELLVKAHDRWDAHMTLVDDSRLGDPMPSSAGAYAGRTQASFVLHMLDEFIHHGAEIGVLRDLWRWQSTVAEDPVVERVMRGDRTVTSEPTLDLASVASAPELVDTAAAYGRWDLLLDLVRAGLTGDSATTPLHRAAIAGELGVVQALVQQGADPEAKDPVFDATPAQWAMFLKQTAVVDWLDNQGT